MAQSLVDRPEKDSAGSGFTFRALEGAACHDDLLGEAFGPGQHLLADYCSGQWVVAPYDPASDHLREGGMIPSRPHGEHDPVNGSDAESRLLVLETGSLGGAL